MFMTVISSSPIYRGTGYCFRSISLFVCTGWAKKTGLFLRVDNFATVGDRNACDMSKFSKFYLEKNSQFAYQYIKYSLPNLHKYSMSLKLR